MKNFLATGQILPIMEKSMALYLYIRSFKKGKINEIEGIVRSAAGFNDRGSGN
jgi:hypothetical protein